MSNSFRMLTLSGFLLITILAIQALMLPASSIERFQSSDASATDTPAIMVLGCLIGFEQEWDWEGPAIVGIGAIVGTGASFVEGECLDVKGGGTAAGTPVQLFDCNGTGAQQWRYRNGQIINLPSSRCIDVGDGTDFTGATIQDCNGSSGKVWSIQ